MLKFSQFYIVLLFLFSIFKIEAKELEKMSLEEKVGQVFMTYFEGTEVNEAAYKLIAEAKIGGIIYYNWANDLSDPTQVQKLSFELQKIAKKHQKTPLFIATDQETGLVTRLKKGFTEFPGNGAVGATGSSKLAYQAAYVVGSELKAVGINMNLAPVVDLNSNSKNPIIGIRSFHSDPKIVTAFGRASIEGYLKSGIIPCLKHFPGHGDVTEDSHLALPVVNKSLRELEEVELYPFENLASQAPAMMTAHICFPSLDSNNCATFSKIILTDFLREKIGYDGLLITDSLTMGGATKDDLTPEEAVIRAFEAGNDILLIGGRALNHKVKTESNLDEILRLHKNFLEAVKSGRIPIARLDNSVARILKAKKEAKLLESTQETIDLKKVLNLDSSRKIAKEIAYRSVRAKNGLLIEDLDQKKILILAPEILKETLLETDLSRLSPQIQTCFFKELEPNPIEKTFFLNQASEADVIVFCSYNSWKYTQQLALLQELGKQKPLICIATRDPYDLETCKSNYIAFATYSPSTCSLQVVAEYLKSETKPLSISFEEAKKVSEKIWQNECNHRIDQLTFWNIKEPFPSIGIGHFIWPPQSYNGTFSSGRFHKVVHFMKSKGAKVPDWLLKARYCPWETREDFYNAIDSKQMNELREFLVESTPYQTMYMLERLNKFFKDVMIELSDEEKILFADSFFKVANSPNGPYILIDYINFKHEGTNPQERYKGKGWGLLQVLQNMNHEITLTSPEDAFITSAREALLTRVKNSPNQEIEKTWIPNWLSRLETYRCP